MNMKSITFPDSKSTKPSSTYCVQDRNGLLIFLCEALADRFGITPNKQMILKLNRIFIDMDFWKLRSHVTELSSLPAGHSTWFELVAKLTVHETYFFRDEPQLTTVRDRILPNLIEKNAREKTPSLRILSAGCSTGEEVYSLTMLTLDSLQDAGYTIGSARSGLSLVSNWDLEVVGVDVSADALFIAKKGCYTEEGLGSFRKMESRWNDWFDDVDPENSPVKGISTTRRPKEFVRNHTRFERHNLLQKAMFFGFFDLILCRNTMIYFCDKNKFTAQQYLFDLLKPGGVLLLGATDPFLCSERCVQHNSKGISYYMNKEPM